MIIDMKLHVLISFCLLCTLPDANAQLLDAIRGHAKDLRVRFDDHQKIDGELDVPPVSVALGFVVRWLI